MVVCGGNCPLIRAERNVEKWNFAGSGEGPLDEARMVRDEIKRRVLNLIGKG